MAVPDYAPPEPAQLEQLAAEQTPKDASTDIAAAQDATPHQTQTGVLHSFEQMGHRVATEAHSVASNTSALVSTAMGFMGLRYRRGGNSAETGFDCSGFVRAVYQKTAGMVLPRRAKDQAASTKTIDKSELKPGDLVFFNTLRRTFSHVGVYLGDGKFIHSPRTGEQVRIDDMHSKYWKTRFNGARRVALDAAMAARLSAAQSLIE